MFSKSLYHILKHPFTTRNTSSHKDRLEAFYKNQAEDYDNFRENFLWGRKAMISLCEAYMRNKTEMVWIDMGGGTGQTVYYMSQMMSLDRFSKIYIVDMCEALCEEAKKKVESYGWTNVEVVCGDATKFRSPEKPDLITFSYSLSMIPPFHEAIDNAYKQIDKNGYIAVSDFYVSDRYDKPDRQMSWMTRTFWKSLFDIDNVQLGSERRAYLEYMFHTLHECNSYGSIPYLSFLKAPYYVWIGTKNKEHEKTHITIHKTKAPALFPPTFLYHQCWEDPETDRPILDIQPTDVCLTLTSGGCNSLHLLLQNAAKVVSVDVNPAQTALLELKAVAIKHLDYETFWQIFGEGKYSEIDTLYHDRLAPFLSTTSKHFWNKKKHYFKHGLYKHGSMGKISLLLSSLINILGIEYDVEQLINSSNIEEQVYRWECILNKLIPKKAIVASILRRLAGLVFLNSTVSWFGGGVPVKQLEKMKEDNIHITDYFMRCIDGMMRNSHIKKENYFYLNLLQGKYSKECCPEYLKEENFQKMKEGELLHNLVISNDFFINELQKREYDKIILMDHADWQTEQDTMVLARALYNHTKTGAKIILRSAGLQPHYIEQLRDVGFDVICLQRIDQTSYMDRVNMYASFYMCVKK